MDCAARGEQLAVVARLPELAQRQTGKGIHDVDGGGGDSERIGDQRAETLRGKRELSAGGLSLHVVDQLILECQP